MLLVQRVICVPRFQCCSREASTLSAAPTKDIHGLLLDSGFQVLFGGNVFYDRLFPNISEFSSTNFLLLNIFLVGMY